MVALESVEKRAALLLLGPRCAAPVEVTPRPLPPRPRRLCLLCGLRLQAYAAVEEEGHPPALRGGLGRAGEADLVSSE